MKKRIFTLMLAAFCLLSLLTGCVSKDKPSSEDPVTLSMWHVYGSQTKSPLNTAIDEFNNTIGKENGITVNVVSVTSSSAIDKALAASANAEPGAEELPDLFTAYPRAAQIVGTDRLLAWDPYFSEAELSMFKQEFLQEGYFDSRLLMLPVAKSTEAFFLNKTLFSNFSAQTGVSMEQLQSFEGLFAAANVYYDWSGGKCFCAFDYLIRHMEFDLMAQTGGIEYTEDGWYHLEDPAVKASWMKFALPFAQGHICVSDTYSNTQVMTGETLAGIGSTASITYYNDTVTYPDNTSEPMNLVVLPLPKTGDGTQYMPITGVGMSAFKSDDERKAEAAAEFLRWFTESQRNLDFVVETGYMPVRTDAFASIDNYAFPTEGYASLYDTIKVMLENYEPVVRPDFDGFYKRVTALYDGLRQIQPDLLVRAGNGEDVGALAEEVWDFLCSVE